MQLWAILTSVACPNLWGEVSMPGGQGSEDTSVGWNWQLNVFYNCLIQEDAVLVFQILQKFIWDALWLDKNNIFIRIKRGIELLLIEKCFIRSKIIFLHKFQGPIQFSLWLAAILDAS